MSETNSYKIYASQDYVDEAVGNTVHEITTSETAGMTSIRLWEQTSGFYHITCTPNANGWAAIDFRGKTGTGDEATEQIKVILNAVELFGWMTIHDTSTYTLYEFTYLVKGDPRTVYTQYTKETDTWVSGTNYLSNTYLSVPSTAEVGQTIVVKAVDGNGKPTAWEAADLSSGGTGEWEHICDISVSEADSLTTVEQSLGADYRKIMIVINNSKTGGIVNAGSDSWPLRIRANSNPNDNTLVAVCNSRAVNEGWNTFRFVIEYVSAGEFATGVTYTYGTTNTVFEKTNFNIKAPIHTVYLVANGGMLTFTARIFGVKA